MANLYPYGDFSLQPQDTTNTEDWCFVSYRGPICDTGMNRLINVGSELSTTGYKGMILRIYSNGGNLNEGLRGGRSLVDMGLFVMTYVPEDVEIQSAALPLLFAGNLTGVAPGVKLGFHRAWAKTNLFNLVDAERAWRVSQAMKELQSFTVDQTRADSTMTEALMRQETITTLTAEDAQRYGYIDFVEILRIPQKGRRVEIIAGQDGPSEVYFK